MKYSIIFLLLGFCFQLRVQSQPQKWNRQMQLKSCKIRINSGKFTASTFIEMEFYNPNDQELEGLHTFKLNPGQVITAFQLELNGKYRDGTLEEKWKATNAYNTIVGKRIDPALLSMDQNNVYSLRIYPVPARGSRKITFTIQQLLTVDKDSLRYALPLNIPDTVERFQLSVNSNNLARPQSGKGMINGRNFIRQNTSFVLNTVERSISLRQPISFSVPLHNLPVVCQLKLNNTTHFAIRIPPNADSVHPIKAQQLTVFWDASGSAKSRDVEKEIRFLQHFVAYHSIRQLRIIPFNHRLKDTAVFEMEKGNHQLWKQYLRNVQYSGATQLGCIFVPKNAPGLAMLFSDGVNSYGSNNPVTNGALFFCVNSASQADRVSLRNLAGSSGGKLIDLATTTISNAIAQSSTIQNWLMDVTSTTGKTIIEQNFPMTVSDFYLINGSSAAQADTLVFHYGNGNRISSVKKIELPGDVTCDEPLMSRLNMLEEFDELIRSHDWEKKLDIGLQENIVTPNTAYIVLERIEDYIRYNIEAPADLQKECEALQYVKSNTRIQRQQLKQQDEFSTINAVVNIYNQQFKKILGAKGEIAVTRQHIEELKQKSAGEQAQVDASSGAASSPQGIYGLTAGNNRLDEVVVVGYGAQNKSSVTGSVIHVRRSELDGFQNVAQALQGRVAGLMVTPSVSPGSASNIMIRGIASLRGNGQPLFVLDGVPVGGNIDELVNINDIQDITVLRGVQAFSIYGSQAANGAIVIKSKRGNYNSYYDYTRKYRLKDMEDVEYMQEIKGTSVQTMSEKYRKLEEMFSNEPGFYFDMATHFFEKGLKQEAFEILMQAAERGNGNANVLHAVAFVLENWQMYKDAIVVYEQMVSLNPASLVLRRDLAWAWYQAGNYQTAVNVFYEAINLKQGEYDRLSDKATLLYEMNQVIALHKNVLDTTLIPAGLIQELPSDLRIVLNSNNGHVGFMRVKEPGGVNVSFNHANKGSILYGNDRWYYDGNISVYQATDAKPGKYKLLVSYYSYHQNQQVPSFIRIKTFKNFGKPDQAIEIENVVMDNQHGEIEIATVEYKMDKKE